MKTAMQELISELKYQFSHSDNHLQTIVNIVQKAEDELFKKEKEQMLSFGLYVKKNGWVGCKIEEMYEDYNNQNK